MWESLRPPISGSNHSLTNAYQFLQDVTLKEDEAMVSFDVTAGFNSINVDLAMKITEKLLQKKKPEMKTSHESLPIYLLHI